MRNRIVIAVATLVLSPAALLAQHVPIPVVGRGPVAPEPVPRVPEHIARELAYKQMRVAVESYPLMILYQSPGFSADGRTTTWGSAGAGTRGEYHFTPTFSGTLDLTSSLVGGPATVQTAELGVRARPAPSERRVYPYADVRAGYVSAYHGSLGSFVEDVFGDPTPSGGVAALYSRGFGLVAGAGVEYALTRRFSLTTGGSLMRSRLTAHDVNGSQPGDRSFAMNALRYTIGLRYNPVRIVSTSVIDGR